MRGGVGRRQLVGGGLPALLFPSGAPASTPAPIDARHVVLCSWIFDHEHGAPPPFGFTLMRSWRDEAAGHLAALLGSTGADGRAEVMLVNRGTRADTESIGAALRAFRADMAANLAILRGHPDPPIIAAALRVGEDAAAAAGGARLMLLGQSLGGGLAQLQAVALHLAAPGREARFATFAASDVAGVVAQRFNIDSAGLPMELGDNWVSRRDGLTGPGALFGTSRIGRQHVVRDMGGPLITAWPGLEFHRAGSWVKYCAGRRVDAETVPHPASALDWRRLAANGCHLPEGWLAPG